MLMISSHHKYLNLVTLMIANKIKITDRKSKLNSFRKLETRNQVED